MTSWKQIAKDLHDALAGCDWSYQRAQTEPVFGKIDAAMAAYDRKSKTRIKKRRHCYQIIGARSRKVIGHCFGQDGKDEVLSEEPGASFRRITLKELRAWEKRHGEFGEKD